MIGGLFSYSCLWFTHANCITHLSYSCETFSRIHFIPIVFPRTRFCHAIKLLPAAHVFMACRRWSNCHSRLCCHNRRTDVMMADVVNDDITNDDIINNNYNMMDSYWSQSRFVFWHYTDRYFGHACLSSRILYVCACEIGGLMRIRMELDTSLVSPIPLVLAHFFRVHSIEIVVGIFFPVVASVACSCLRAKLFFLDLNRFLTCALQFSFGKQLSINWQAAQFIKIVNVRTALPFHFMPAVII